MERNVYCRYRNFGIVLHGRSSTCCCSACRASSSFAVQMLANPLMAAGVINGIGHYYGYRNFECPDAARNIVPWGFLVAGEELHNNHHAFPSSAKFSMQRWEFDIGWLYIRVFQTLGLAKVIRVAPAPAQVAPRKHIDLETVRAVIVNRMHVLRDYTRNVTLPVFREELRVAGGKLSRRVKKLLVREPVLLDTHCAVASAAKCWRRTRRCKTVHEFRERLRVMWSGANMSNEKLRAAPEGLDRAGRGQPHQGAAGFRQHRCAATRCSPPDSVETGRRDIADQRKSPPKGGLFRCRAGRSLTRRRFDLLDLRFLVGHVLADLRVEFLDFHLVRMQALVLGRGVEVAGAGRRQRA